MPVRTRLEAATGGVLQKRFYLKQYPKNETPTQVFSCEFCKFLINLFCRIPPVAASKRVRTGKQLSPPPPNSPSLPPFLYRTPSGAFFCTLHRQLLFPRNWDILTQLKLIATIDEKWKIFKTELITGSVVLFDIRTSWRLNLVFKGTLVQIWESLHVFVFI